MIAASRFMVYASCDDLLRRQPFFLRGHLLELRLHRRAQVGVCVVVDGHLWGLGFKV